MRTVLGIACVSVCLLGGCDDKLKPGTFACLKGDCRDAGAAAESPLSCGAATFDFGNRPAGRSSRLDLECRASGSADTITAIEIVSGSALTTATLLVAGEAVEPPLAFDKVGVVRVSGGFAPFGDDTVDAIVKLTFASGAPALEIPFSGIGLGPSGCADVIAEDFDCDGVSGILDCNEYNPGFGSRIYDGDCDGSLVYVDCDDSNPLASSETDDRDCDGSPSTVDCDDSDPTQWTRARTTTLCGAENLYRIGGSITGLTGDATAEIQLNATETLVVAENGSFFFTGELGTGTPFEVTVIGSAGWQCIVEDGAGTIKAAHVASPRLACQPRCDPNPCTNGGTCAATANGVACSCPEGFGGSRCANAAGPCTPTSCSSQGTCENAADNQSHTCECPSGFSGLNCEDGSDECGTLGCQNGGTCSNGVCACTLGYDGVHCGNDIDDCADTPCENGGACADGVDSFTCACPVGYDGETCETNIDDCADTPCENGGICTDAVASFSCACAAGYDGNTCETNIDDCTETSCANGGVCTDGVEGFTCVCPVGYDGDTCENNIDDCIGTVCANGGTCIDGIAATTCTCVTGYSGATCETNIDDCADDPCQNSGVCSDGVDQYTCECVAGFAGLNCDVNIDDCASVTCENGGTCVDGVNSYTCACADGYSGSDCSTNIDDCDPNPCLNDAACTDGVADFTCTCLDGFSGTNCETNIDDCLPNPCPANTACIDGIETFTCGSLLISGGSSTCVRATNAVTKCWGSNADGLLAVGNTNNRGDSKGSEMGDALPAVDFGDRTAVSIDTARLSSCALLDNDRIRCWGYGVEGALGHESQWPIGTSSDDSVAAAADIDLGAGLDVAQFSMGDDFVCAVVVDEIDASARSLKCWGTNGFGQLGLGDMATRGESEGTMGTDLPAVDFDGSAVQSVGSGRFSACAVIGTGATRAIACWGANLYGQLGVDDTDSRGDEASEMGSNLSPIPDFGSLPDEVDCGEGHCCARLDNGSVYCWGSNGYGQLGRGDTTSIGDDDTPGIAGAQAVDLGDGRAAVQIATGWDHSCAVLDNGVLKCWGRNSNGQLGQGDTDNRGDEGGEMGDNLGGVPVGQIVVSVDAGIEHTCATLVDGGVRCWGRGDDGRLGNDNLDIQGDDAGEIAGATAIDLGFSATAVAAGERSSCAMAADGEVKCWGYNEFGTLGNGSTWTQGDGPGTMGDSLAAIDPGSGRSVAQVAMSSGHGCATLDNGDVKCWGANGWGSLGVAWPGAALGDEPGELGDDWDAVNLGSGLSAASVAVGNYTSCALLTDDTVKCWGFNIDGQNGLGDTATRGDDLLTMGDALGRVDLGGTVTAIHARGGSICALMATGDIKCWGDNSVGQLGLGNTESIGDEAGEATGFASVDLGDGRTASRMALGESHACAIVDTGGLKCWGTNYFGELGIVGDARGDDSGEMGDALPYVDLGSGRVAKDVVAGSNLTCVILDTGAVACWGLNDNGQLGLGDINSRGISESDMGANLQTVDLGEGLTATGLVAGAAHVCAALSDSSIRCWGNNTRGELGRHDQESIGDEPDEMGAALKAVVLEGAVE